MKRIWLSPDLQDLDAHKNALQTLPQLYILVEDAKIADFKMTNENSPDLVLNQINHQISSTLEDNFTLVGKFVNFRAFYSSLPSNDRVLEFISKLFNRKGELVAEELNFQFAENALIVMGEIDRTILSMIFIVSKQVEVVHRFVASDRTSRLVIEIPATFNARATQVELSDKYGTFKLRPRYESSAKEFWIQKAI
jgi:hypothetical protein